MEERSAILSHGRPQYVVVNWINSERLELHYERKAQLDVVFQQADGLVDQRCFWETHLNPTRRSP